MLRALQRLAVSSLRALPALLLLQCGTEAVGVAQCRTIENARCVAAAQCGLIEDVEACQRFAHDHCLHGLPLEEAPASNASDACAEALLRAGRCAERDGKRTAPTSCSQSRFAQARAKNVCEIVEQPERTEQCAFLTGEERSNRRSGSDAGASSADARGDGASSPPDSPRDAGTDASR